MLWTETTINGRKCASADYNGKRLYISHISRGVEAWVDGIRLGVFASDEQARKSCIASSAGTKVVAPKAECRPIRPFDGSKFDSRKYVAGEQMNVTIQVDGQPPLPVEPPIKIGDLTITHALIPGMGTPFLDRSTPAEPVITTTASRLAAVDIEMPTPPALAAAHADWIDKAVEAPPILDNFVKRAGHCDNCGAALGRSGKCPALCTPVTDAAPYKDTGPIGKSHTARLGAPVRW